MRIARIARIQTVFVVILGMLIAFSFETRARADTADALVPWPRLLDAALETIALRVRVVGDLQPGFEADNVEAKCFEYLRNSLASIPDVKVVLLSDIILQGILQRQPISERGTIAVQYLVTVKEWNDTGSAAPVLIGAVELDIKQPWRPARASSAIQFPLGLFLVTPGGANLPDGLTAAIKHHLDRYVVAQVQASRSK